MDNSLTILMMEAAISLAGSLVIILLFQTVLRALLQDLCHGEIRAAFWSAFTRLMLLIAPFLMVLLFSHSLTDHVVPLAQVIRDALLHTLLGHFLGLIVVGKLILNFSRREQAAVSTALMPVDANGEQ